MEPLIQWFGLVDLSRGLTSFIPVDGLESTSIFSRVWLRKKFLWFLWFSFSMELLRWPLGRSFAWFELYTSGLSARDIFFEHWLAPCDAVTGESRFRTNSCFEISSKPNFPDFRAWRVVSATGISTTILDGTWCASATFREVEHETNTVLVLVDGLNFLTCSAVSVAKEWANTRGYNNLTCLLASALSTLTNNVPSIILLTSMVLLHAASNDLAMKKGDISLKGSPSSSPDNAGSVI